jgi:hypothetical protein
MITLDKLYLSRVIGYAFARKSRLGFLLGHPPGCSFAIGQFPKLAAPQAAQPAISTATSKRVLAV